MSQSNKQLLSQLFEFIAGLVFGMGLIVAGMTDPSKVLGFLDLLGPWDPSLAFVMGGAIMVGTIAFALSRKRGQTLLGGPLHVPASPRISQRLVLGSLVFGVGWGIAGFCPGPAIVSLGAGQAKALVFVGAMLGGMALFEAFERLRRRNL